uniref:BED-type domain-containing protein n=1 Tax=Timema poppense TaxID=170557 RepID=A0A7R9DEG0_TIMPO|nr:unnamed protein product [Timema poppensis]
MPRRKSQLWNHFTKIGDKQAQCDYCSKVISVSCGSMGNLMRHIRVKHSTVPIFIRVPKNNMSIPSDDQSEPCLVTQQIVDEDNMANVDVNSNLHQPSTSDQNNQMEQVTGPGKIRKLAKFVIRILAVLSDTLARRRQLSTMDRESCDRDWQNTQLAIR